MSDQDFIKKICSHCDKMLHEEIIKDKKEWKFLISHKESYYVLNHDQSFNLKHTYFGALRGSMLKNKFDFGP
jgi:glucan-binding YG repeat protein